MYTLSLSHTVERLQEMHGYNLKYPGAFEACDGVLEKSLDDLLEWYGAMGFYEKNGWLMTDSYCGEKFVWSPRDQKWYSWEDENVPDDILAVLEPDG